MQEIINLKYNYLAIVRLRIMTKGIIPLNCQGIEESHFFKQHFTIKNTFYDFVRPQS